MTRFFLSYHLSLLLGLSLSASACGGSAEPGDPSDSDSDVGGAGGAPEPVPEEPISFFASEVVSTDFGEGQDFGRENLPDVVLGGPQGGGATAGSLDVVSLGDGGSLVLGFGGKRIVDGPGVDFIVFENPFLFGADESPLAELAEVSVSADGETWVTFPCEPGESAPYGDCAGWRPVLANVETEAGDPFDPELSGGDLYDLSDVGVEFARYVRITDLFGDPEVFDLDALAVINGREEAEAAE